MTSAMIEDFARLMKTVYGVKVLVHNMKSGDEYARFMFRGSFFVIRDNEGDEDALELELASSDKEQLRELQEVWVNFILARMKEEEDVTESSDG